MRQARPVFLAIAALLARGALGVSLLCGLGAAGALGGAGGVLLAGVSPTPPPMPLVTLGARGERLRIAVVGDTGDDPAKVAAAINQHHRTQPLDAIMILGDNFYPCGVSSESDPQWSKVTAHFSPIGIPLFPILGNHDYGNPIHLFENRWHLCGNPKPAAQVSSTRKIRNWVFPARSYRISATLADFFMIDTTPIVKGLPGALLGSDSGAMVQRKLRAALASSNSRWKIVAGHHPVYSSGRHGKRQDGSERRNMRPVLTLLNETGVDLYVCGHDHHLELIGRDSQDGSGPLFLISGAGSKLRDIERRDAARPATLFPLLPSETFLGFAVLEIDRRQIGITFFDSGNAARGKRFVFEKTEPVLARGAAVK